MRLVIDGRPYQVELRADGVIVEGTLIEAAVEGKGNPIGVVVIKGRRYYVRLEPSEKPSFRVNVDGKEFNALVEGWGPSPTSPPLAPTPTPKGVATLPGAITALMPARVVSVKVKEGQRVEEGEVLLILETMKMESEVLSPRTGVVTAVAVSPGASVNAGDVLLVVE